MLEIKKLTKNFKGVQAVSNLDLNVNSGEIVGIIGPNGAGKTTVFNLITGYLQPTKGEVIFNGKDITGQKPHVIAKHGVVRTFQLDRIFHNFSVTQNVVTASYLYAGIGLWEAAFDTSGYRKKNRNTGEYARHILKFMRLDDKKNEIARNLSHGHQKLLGIAIALAANPKVLLLDEPLGGMNPAEVDGTLEIIGEIRKQGAAILLVEHDMQAVMRICDRIVVLNFGMEIARGSPEEVQKDKEVIQAYLGTKRLYTQTE
ncbi:MAG: ABC transporter ATP-binding protein [Thermodesulfobacteriota bacterium]|jgi:branched-chain amino acid transport system ATP-binding protein